MKIKNVQTSAFLKNLAKAYTEGVYSDTPNNRKLGRVGMSYKQYNEKLSSNTETNKEDGHYETFIDEDTGEKLNIWVNNKSNKKVNKEDKKYKSALIKEKKIKDKYLPLSEKLIDLKQNLKNKLQEYKQLEIDQEEEIGALNDSNQQDSLAQKYGEQFNKLDSEIVDLKNKIKNLEPKIKKLEEELNSVWDY